MKTLNIDALAKTTRTLTFGGETYPVLEMTVENFIETSKEAAALEKKDGVTFLDQLQMTMNIVRRSVPTLPVEKLQGLSIEQLVTVSKFLRGELDKEATEVEEVVEGEDGKK